METYRNTLCRGSSEDDSDEDEEITAAMLASKRKQSDSSNVIYTDIGRLSTNEETITETTKKRKVNDVWSKVMNEIILTEDLGQCKLKPETYLKQDRNCENYDYTRKALDNSPKIELIEISSEQANEPEPNIIDLEKVGYGNAAEPIVIKKRKVKFNIRKEEAEKITREISGRLKEQKTDLINRVVVALGKTKSLEFVRMVEDIEQGGGMQILNGSRRRTPGGVLFYLVKNCPTLENNVKDFIFGDDIIKHKEYKKKFQKKSHKKMLKANQKKKEHKKALMETDGTENSDDSNLPPLPTRRELFDMEQCKEEIIDNDKSSADVSDELEDGEIVDD